VPGGVYQTPSEPDGEIREIKTRDRTPALVPIVTKSLILVNIFPKSQSDPRTRHTVAWCCSTIKPDCNPTFEDGDKQR
jgi:hypothetical protein